jgi:hypothetical protein
MPKLFQLLEIPSTDPDRNPSLADGDARGRIRGAVRRRPAAAGILDHFES